MPHSVPNYYLFWWWRDADGETVVQWSSYNQEGEMLHMLGKLAVEHANDDGFSHVAIRGNQLELEKTMSVVFRVKK